MGSDAPRVQHETRTEISEYIDSAQGPTRQVPVDVLESWHDRLQDAEKVVEAAERARHWPDSICSVCGGDRAIPRGDPDAPEWEQCQFCAERDGIVDAVNVYRDDYPEDDDDA